jgi:hypothetical protein
MDFATRTGAQEPNAIIVIYIAFETDRNGRRRQSCGRTDFFPCGVDAHTDEADDPVVLGVGAHGACNAHGE